MKRILRLTIGSLCVVIGVIGLLMPVLPGWLFIIPGMLLLGLDHDWMLRVIDWLERKWPSQRQHCERLRRVVHGHRDRRKPAQPTA